MSDISAYLFVRCTCSRGTAVLHDVLAGPVRQMKNTANAAEVVKEGAHTLGVGGGGGPITWCVWGEVE